MAWVNLETEVAEEFAEWVENKQGLIDAAWVAKASEHKLRTRERVARFRRIKAGQRGFRIEERVCIKCGTRFGVVVGGLGAKKKFCRLKCQDAWQHRVSRLGSPTASPRHG